MRIALGETVATKQDIKDVKQDIADFGVQLDHKIDMLGPGLITRGLVGMAVFFAVIVSIIVLTSIKI